MSSGQRMGVSGVIRYVIFEFVVFRLEFRCLGCDERILIVG